MTNAELIAQIDTESKKLEEQVLRITRAQKEQDARIAKLRAAIAAAKSS